MKRTSGELPREWPKIQTASKLFNYVTVCRVNICKVFFFFNLGDGLFGITALSKRLFGQLVTLSVVYMTSLLSGWLFSDSVGAEVARWYRVWFDWFSRRLTFLCFDLLIGVIREKFPKEHLILFWHEFYISLFYLATVQTRQWHDEITCSGFLTFVRVSSRRVIIKCTSWPHLVW